MFIDTHAHLFRNPQDLDRMAADDTIDEVWVMEVTYYCKGFFADLVWGDEFLALVRQYAPFIRPFGFLDYRQGPEQIDRMREAGYRGLKAIRPPEPYDHPAYFPLYERARDLKMPILFHLGNIVASTREEMCMDLPTGATNMRPSMLCGIAAAFPDLPLIAGHMGDPWFEELRGLLRGHPNTFCSLCGGVDYRWLIEHLHEPCYRGKGDIIADRMMFASDACYGRADLHQDVRDVATFKDGFFRFVGGHAGWGDRREAFRNGTAKRLLAMVGE